MIDRIDRICSLARGITVLDVGCVSHESRAENEKDWLHRRISEVAKSCLGIDILDDDIKALKEKGYNVMLHDISHTAMDRQFEMIVCGEIIEHLPNAGSFFENCSKSLVPGGKLVITTPYPWFLGTIIRNLFQIGFLPGSMDHVAWYDPATIAEIADRYDFKLVEISGIGYTPSPEEGRVQESLYKLIRAGHLPLLSPLIGCRSLLYVLSKIDS